MSFAAFGFGCIGFVVASCAALLRFALRSGCTFVASFAAAAMALASAASAFVVASFAAFASGCIGFFVVASSAAAAIAFD
jgi:hypothetical protein